MKYETISIVIFTLATFSLSLSAAEDTSRKYEGIEALVTETHQRSLEARLKDRVTTLNKNPWPSGAWGDTLWSLSALYQNEKVEQAKSREELNTAVRALDRSLRALHIWIPQWFNSTYRVAYLDVYEHPENIPPYALGQMDFWWYNADKAKKLQAEGAF